MKNKEALILYFWEKETPNRSENHGEFYASSDEEALIKMPEDCFTLKKDDPSGITPWIEVYHLNSDGSAIWYVDGEETLTQADKGLDIRFDLW